jgi:hypothetical protein
MRPIPRALCLAIAIGAAGLACSSSSDKSGAAGGAGGDAGGDDGGPTPQGQPEGGPGGDAGADAEIGPQGPPAIGFIGRFDTRDPAGPKAAWPGSRIVIRFQGTDLGVRFDDEFADGKPGPSEWEVTIDGVRQPKITLAKGAADYQVAKGLAAGVHVVDLYKRSESQVGVTQLLAVDYHGGSLLAPPPPSDRRIEIVGDSSATGFGVDGVGPDCPVANDAAQWENFRESWGAILGTTFGADVHGSSYSGKGLVKDIWRPDTEVMPLLFPRANPEDDSSTFDLTSWQPHAVVIMIGGNDFDIGQPVDDGPATLDEFTTAYGTLVGNMRAAYPTAHLFLATSPTLSDDYPAGRQSRTNVKTAIASVVAARAGAGDTRVHAVEPSVATAAEITGCDGHGGSAYQVRVAGELAAPIRAAVGW